MGSTTSTSTVIRWVLAISWRNQKQVYNYWKLTGGPQKWWFQSSESPFPGALFWGAMLVYNHPLVVCVFNPLRFSAPFFFQVKVQIGPRDFTTTVAFLGFRAWRFDPTDRKWLWETWNFWAGSKMSGVLNIVTCSSPFICDWRKSWCFLKIWIFMWFHMPRKNHQSA